MKYLEYSVDGAPSNAAYTFVNLQNSGWEPVSLHDGYHNY